MGGTGGDGAARHLRAGQEFYPHRVSASGRASGPVVFAGFGISAPHLQYDDLAGNLKGQIVLVLDHEPGERDPNSPFDGVVTSEPSTAWRKALAAQEKGAAAVLFVGDVHNHPGAASFEAAARSYWPATPPRILNYTLAAWADRIRIPVAQISPALAASLVAGTNKTLEELSKSAETARGFAPLPLPGARVELRTAVDRHIVPDRNVVALLEGSDPRLKDEWVIVSAHYDHNGADGAQIFNGADDNGSGTVALVEIAEAYALAAKEGRRPKRSVLFAAWNSEERGLLGAWAYTEQPLAPLKTIAAVLNMDMIGRNEEMPIGGGPRFTGFDVQSAESNSNAVNMMAFSKVPDITAAVEKANAGIALDLKKRYDNNSSNLCGAAINGRSCSAACRRCASTPACIRITTRSTTGPRRSTTSRWKRSRGWCTRRAGTSPTATRVRSRPRRGRSHNIDHEMQPRRHRTRHTKKTTI